MAEETRFAFREGGLLLLEGGAWNKKGQKESFNTVFFFFPERWEMAILWQTGDMGEIWVMSA